MLDQIHEDLGAYPGTVSKEQLLAFLADPDTHAGGYALYTIRNNQVSWTMHLRRPRLALSLCTCRARIMGEALRSLLQHAAVPNVDFIICLEDGSTNVHAVPVLVFAKGKGEHGILVPDFDCLGCEQRLRAVETGRLQYPWSVKQETAFWRGDTTGGPFTMDSYPSRPRYRVVHLSTLFPDQIDAKFTNVGQCDRNTGEILSRYMGTYTSIAEHLKYKYQVLIDGNSCAYSRAHWQLFSNSLILKQESSNMQWYYHQIAPYQHYVPVAHDLSDLVEKVAWARTHDQEAQDIVRRANAFAEANLRHSDLMLYIHLLLCEYAKSYH